MLIFALVAISSRSDVPLAGARSRVLVAASVRRLDRTVDVARALLASVRVLRCEVPITCGELVRLYLSLEQKISTPGAQWSH